MQKLVVLATSVIALAGACKPKENAASDAGAVASAAASAAATSTPAAPTATAVAANPKWMKNAPSKPVHAKVGDIVWAVTPSSSAGDVDVGLLTTYKIDAINGNVASVSGKDGKHDVNGFFILPVGDMTKLKANDAVLISNSWSNGTSFSRVASNDKGKVTAHQFANKQVTDLVVDAATPIPTGGTTAPFSDISYEKFPGKQYKGMIIAQDSGTSWIWDHDDQTVTETKAKLQPLKWGFKDRKAGDKITVFLAGGGATEGTILKAIDPKAFYDVQFNGFTLASTYDQVVDKL